MQSEFENLLLDMQKEYSHSNRIKDKIIIVLIAFMFLEAVIGYCGFVWYESKFDYVTTEQTTHDIDDSVIPKYTKMALKIYYEWETETKELFKNFVTNCYRWENILIMNF